MAEKVGSVYIDASIDTTGVIQAGKAIASTTDKIEKDLQSTGNAATALSTQMTKTATAVNQAGSSMGSLRGVAGNLGFQLQDIAVQAQAGTSAFVILGQQGSQLASAFGPGGAVIGAVIAVAAAIGGVLFTSLNKTSEEIKEEFLPNVKDLKENLDQLSKAQASVAIMQIKEEMKPLPDIARAAAAQVEYLTKQIEKFPSNKDVKKWNDELVVQQAIFDGVGQKIKELNKDQESFLDVIKRNINGTQGQQEADKKRIETLKDLLMATEQQAAIAGLTQRGIALYVAEQAKATKAEIARINAAYDLIEAEEKKKDATKAGTKEDSAKTKALNSVVSGLDEQYQKLIMTTDAYEEYAAVQQAEAANATPAQIAAIRAKVKALQDERKAIQENVDLQDEIAENEKSEAEQKKKITTEFESVKTAVRGELETPAQQADRELAERLAVIGRYAEQEQLTRGQTRTLELQAEAAHQKQITDIRKSEEAARSQSMQTTLSVFGDMFGNLADIAKEGGEKTFKQYKLLASAQAAISAALAVTNVLANPLIPYPLNIGLAASVGALAAVQIAKIQGQSYSAGGGRLYGGPVQAGGMYPVTEDGRPEILKQGNRQYLLPGAQGGQVISNRDMQQAGGGGGISINYSPTIYAQQADFEEIMAGQPEAVLNAVRAGLASEGRTL